MTTDKLKQILLKGTDILFSYNNISSGIISECHNSIFVFQMWYGNEYKEYLSIDVLFTDLLFDGKSLSDIIRDVDFRFL